MDPAQAATSTAHGEAPRKRRTSPDSLVADVARVWAELAGYDERGSLFLAERGLAEVVARSLVKFNAGGNHNDSVNRLGEHDYRIALPLRDPQGKLKSVWFLSADRQLTDDALPAAPLAGSTTAGAWLGAPRDVSAATAVYVTLGALDTLALQSAGVVVIGSTRIDKIPKMAPALGVISGRTFVLAVPNDPDGESQRAFAALATVIRENGGRVCVMATPTPHAGPAAQLAAVGAVSFVAAVKAATASGGSAAGDGSRPPADVFDLPPGRDGDALRKFKVFPCTDLGNAERLIAHHGEDLRYVHAWKNWLVWDGTRWQEDVSGAVMRRGFQTIRGIPLEAKASTKADEKDEILGWSIESESGNHIRNMVSLAASQIEVPIAPSDLDADPWALNVANGTIDLMTGALDPHDRADLLTKMGGVKYDAAAGCTLWLKFLDRIFAGNDAIISYMQRATGYALTGKTGEHCLFIMYGTGRNGKGTFRDVVRALMGDYAHEADFSTFEPSKNEAAGQPREDLVALMGRRFVAASEQNAGKKIDEALIKKLTGEDPIRARRLNENGFQFMPVAKYFLMVNDKPVIRGRDEGIWSRMRLVPFDVEIPEAERDPELRSKLIAELPGILNWALRGCLDWQRHGMDTPPEILAATKEYREEMDVIGAFIQAECVVQPDATVPVKDLYERYVAYCKDSGGYVISANQFGRDLTKRKFAADTHGMRTIRKGIGLRDPQQRIEPPNVGRDPNGERE